MNKLRFSLLLISSLFCLSVYAEDVRVQINGAVLKQSCNVKSGDLNKNIIFNDIDPQLLVSSGYSAEVNKVSIELENCTGNVANMSYMFSGVGDDTYPELLKITGKAGGSPEANARGLAIEILDASKKALSLNKKINFSQEINTSFFTFDFYLRYKSTSQNIDAGDASALLYLDFYYE